MSGKRMEPKQDNGYTILLTSTKWYKTRRYAMIYTRQAAELIENGDFYATDEADYIEMDRHR